MKKTHYTQLINLLVKLRKKRKRMHSRLPLNWYGGKPLQYRKLPLTFQQGLYLTKKVSNTIIITESSGI